MSAIKSWTIPGAAGELIFGNGHLPAGRPEGVVLIAHGFKGYKDYGMFPRLARHSAESGFIAHRFNFSHSGMTNNLETFERPDLFECDTWNTQVHDFQTVIRAVAAGDLDGSGLPYVMFGHSRGGVTALLTAGRMAGDETIPQPSGVITAASPSRCSSFSEAESRQLLSDGYLISPSARTGQELRIGKAFLQEQLEDPEGHDLRALVGKITCPLLLVHGEVDPTVPVQCTGEIAAAARQAKTLVIAGADHVYNTPNPMPDTAAPSEQLQQLLDALSDFARRCCQSGSVPSGT
ncbi:MAG: alpha/beta fold hydrolase [Phycisphaerales bacterium]|nr:MAG: alpha/beta fold hydrolase [Phycisphaerales bacterium]